MVKDASLINENFEGYHIASKLDSHSSRPAFLGDLISPLASQRRVIIKLLSTTSLHDQQRQQDILQKIAVLQELHHPHIVPIIAAGVHNDIPYIMTEYLPSGSLYDRLQQRPAGQPTHPEEAFLILAHVGQALQYAHWQKVIHGYVRPQSILFNTRNDALLTGFYHHALFHSDEIEETDAPELYLYRAPEQLKGQTDEKSDQYALGSLAYTLFTGHQPFIVPAKHTLGTYYKTRSLIAPRLLNPALPLHIEEAILKAMSRDPEQRYSDIAAFLAALKLPLAAGDREMKETIMTLAQIMQDDAPDLPTTPMPGANALVKEQLAANSVRPGGPLTFSNVGLMSGDIVVQGGPPSTFSNPGLAAMSHEDPDVANQATLKVPQPHLVSPQPFWRRVRKNFTSRPQRTVVGILCLVTILIVLVTSVLSLNLANSTKNVNIHATPTANTSSQTGIASSTVTRIGTTGSVTNIPPQKNGPSSQPISGPTTVPKPTAVPRPKPTGAPTPAPVQALIALDALFNNQGMAYAPGQGSLGGGGSSFPANLLPPGGPITLQGVRYLFPEHGPDINDTLVSLGQTISLTPGHYRMAYLLATSTWGPVAGAFQFSYTDGSTSTVSATIPDWYTANGVLDASNHYPANSVLSTPYRYTPKGIENHPVFIYAIPIALDSARVATALILPKQVRGLPHTHCHLEIFALTLLQ